MRTRVLLALALVAFGAIAAAGQEMFTVGIDQSTAADWDLIQAAFEQETGIRVSVRRYSQSSVAFQVVSQALSRSGNHHFFMVPDRWAASLSRYLIDLSDVADDLAEAGVSPTYLSGRSLGVPLPFASGWFLAVLAWPEDREAAIAFLIAAGGGDSLSKTPTLPAQASEVAVAAVTKQKMSRSDHNPKIDGALGALIAAAEATLSSAAAQITTALPSSARRVVEELAQTFGIPFSSATSSVTVVLEPQRGRGSASTVAALSSLGVSRSSIDESTSLVKVTVPLTQLASLAAQLTGVSFFRAPYVPFPLGTPTEGTAAIGASAYHSAGITGAGIKVAVIDLGFVGLTQAQARGDLPYSVVQNDLTGTSLTSGFSHGTAVAEIIHDIAPDAQLYLIKIADEIDLDQAITYCLNNGIDVINHSLGWYNTNYYDGTGTIPDMARRATSGGILWVNAAGNEAESHWEGTFVDGNSDGWLDSSVSLYASSGSQIVLYLTWNEWTGAWTDYDLYLYDPSSSIVASSTKYQTGVEEPTESIHATAAQSGTYTIRIQGVGSKSLELYSVFQNLSPAIAASSVLAPANAAEVIAVGAINHANYTTGPQESYSSRGPTNDGRTKPDLVAPDNVTTGTSPYTTFPGTSGSAPHAAGAAALLLSQQPALSEPALRSLLLSNTIPMGSSNVYGNGRLFLQAPTANQAPTGSFTYFPSPPTAGALVTFNGSASSDVDGVVVGYEWDFNADGLTDAIGVSTTRTFQAAGTYQVRLTVTDDDGASGTQTQTVNVVPAANQSPTASFSASPSPAEPNEWITFDASASSDSDGYITGWSWTFGDGATRSGATAYYAYANPGTYTAQLVVTDDDGATGATSRQIVVQAAAAPDLTISSLTFFPPSPTTGQSLTFTFTVQNVGSSDAGLFRIRLQGSASATQTYLGGLSAGSSRTLSLSLALAAGSETFTVTADDQSQVDESNEGNNVRSVVVTASAPPPPVAEAGGPYSGTAGQSIAFSGSSSTGSITSYGWSFGDGGTGSGVSPTHAYAFPGSYTATLTVNGPGGQSADFAQVSVGQPQPPLTAQLSLPQATYQVGDALVISYTTNRTAYIYLCEVTPDNRVVLLYPSWFERTNPVSAGTHTVPGGGYTLRVAEPTGSEGLYLFAATSPVPTFPTTFWFSFPTLSTNPGSFRDGVLATLQTLVPSGDWSFDTLSFEVVPAAPTTGTLQVVSFPSAAAVRLDGTSIGSTPIDRDGVSPGTHTVELTKSGYQTETRQVTITAGQTTTLQVTLVALPPANQSPTAAFTYAPTSPAVGETVQFNGQGSFDPDGSIVAHGWSFDDGGTASGALASHAFSVNLTYQVTLTVTDDDGATGSVTKSITVTPSDEIGWVSPVAFEDPAGEWLLEENTYDNNIDPNDVYGAYVGLGGGELSSFLFLLAPQGGVLSNRVRLFTAFGGGLPMTWDVDVERDGAWIDVFDGTGGKLRWTEVAFDQGLVTRVRIRVQNPPGGATWRALVYEVDIRDATIPLP